MTVCILTNYFPDHRGCSVVTPTSFVYGNSIDASRFVQLEDMECSFQPLNLTFQVISDYKGLSIFSRSSS